MSLRIGELFAGYGGLGMGVQAVFGGEMAWYSEIDKGALKILSHRFPDVPNLGDITAVDWSQVEPVDILTGGSPCQDLSHAGKRAGMTEGTRSNLWVAMREAIAQLRPRLVIWENVAGAYSALAESEPASNGPCESCLCGCVDEDHRGLESDAGLLGDGAVRPSLRALGRVLGDLASLGYDAGWHGLRAADVGAPHGRFRVFVVAYAASDAGRFAHRDGLPVADTGRLRERARRGTGPGEAQGGRPLSHIAGRGDEPLTLLGTPTSRDWKDGGPQENVPVNGLLGRQVWALLPTPAVNDMGEGKTPERWDEWTADMQARHGNGNGHGKSLAIEAQRLLPTPTSRDSAASGGSTPADVTLTDAVVRTDLGSKENPRHAVSTEARPGEVLPRVRGPVDPQEVRERAPRGSRGVPASGGVLPGVREHERDGGQGHASLAGEEAQGADLSGLRDDEAAACSPRGPKPGEQRPGEPDDALRELSPQAALAGGSGEAAGREPLVDWGPYAAAIRRWEVILGRPAPPPTILSKKGNPQLCPEFVTWLMGLPAGWVTDVPGITRNEALKALGNGVVPQQAEAAIRTMLAWEVAA